MKLFFLTVFSFCFNALSQNDSVKFNFDTCRFETSWYRASDYWDSIPEGFILAESGPFQDCGKSDCTVNISTKCETKEFHFVIYNRWGEIQFETTTVGNGWYAYGNPEEVYIWQIDGIYLSGEKFKFRGHFILLNYIEVAE